MRRRDEFAEAALAHDRNTKDSRARHQTYVSHKAVLDNHRAKAEAEIAGMEARKEELRKVIADMDEKAEDLEGRLGGEEAVQGAKDTANSAKYEAFLEMESDELDLE